jgi:hypothetical protein
VTTPDARPHLQSLTIADDPARWATLGFTIDDGARCTVGTTRIDFTDPGGGRGLIGWTLAGARDGGDLDGLATRWIAPAEATAAASAPSHANGAVRLDHVVVFTPDLDRTTAALAAAGMDLRRTREAGTAERPLRQAFYRLGEVILEVVGDVVEDGPDAPARFWGLVAVVPDVDELPARLGDEVIGTPKDAVQPGRRIATVRRGAGLGVPLAFLTEDPRHA